MKKLCKKCGIEFSLKKNAIGCHRYQLFCSRECSVKYHDILESKRIKDRTNIKRCEICEKEIQIQVLKNYLKKKYCSYECLNISRNNKRRKRYHANVKLHREKAKEERKSPKVKKWHLKYAKAWGRKNRIYVNGEYHYLTSCDKSIKPLLEGLIIYRNAQNLLKEN